MFNNGLFIITVLVFIFVAWVATGGPTRPISQAGLFITPVTRPGEESQGYRYIVPTNPISTSSYPRQIAGGRAPTTSGPDPYARTTSTGTEQVYLERSSIGPASGNPNQEYVSIVNVGATTRSLAGWRLSSRATGASVTLPTVAIPVQGKLIVVTGRSSDAFATTLCVGDTPCYFLNRSLEFYAPVNETVTLMNADGAVVDSFSY